MFNLGDHQRFLLGLVHPGVWLCSVLACWPVRTVTQPQQPAPVLIIDDDHGSSDGTMMSGVELLEESEPEGFISLASSQSLQPPPDSPLNLDGPDSADAALPADPEPVEELPRLTPLDIDRKVANQGHQAVVDHVLPELRSVMLSEDFCREQPRQQVHRALLAVDRAGRRFWGTHLTYTRKRTVEDLVLHFYYDDVRRRL